MRTGSALTFRKVLPMHLAVTLGAEGLSVANLVTKVGKVGKRLDMVGVQFRTALTAFLASVIVTLKDSLSPFAESVSVTRSFVVKGNPTLPVGCVFTGHVLLSAVAGAILSAISPVVELRTAVFASVLVGRSTIGPALFRAEARRLSAILFLLVLRSADLTRKGYAVASSGCRALTGAIFRVFTPRVVLFAALRASMCDFKPFRHRAKYTRGALLCFFDPGYCAVILERCSESGMDCELIE
jgi:hypothetical protein